MRVYDLSLAVAIREITCQLFKARGLSCLGVAVMPCAQQAIVYSAINVRLI
jgi:hypothetical protein